MMLHPLRSPLLASLGIAIVTGATPLAAQRTSVTVRGGARAESASERQLRALERRADSLAYLYNEADELSSAERRRVGEILDRTVAQIDLLSARLAQMRGGEARSDGEIRVRLSPMSGDAAGAFMLRALTASRVMQPRGWLGIEVVGPAREPRIEDGDQIIHYLGYPAIISVEPSSPAERAGLIPGDTLIAYDGHDVSDADIAITRLLEPNKRVNVRIRRDGRTRDVPVTIADVPSRIALRRELNVQVVPPGVATTLTPGVRFPRPANAPAPPARSMMEVPSPMPALPAAAPRVAYTPTPAAVPIPPTAWTFGFGGVSGVAGAQLVAVTEGLGRTLGVRSGVLVTNAPSGSPAYQSGLRDGDVIIRAAGTPLHTVGNLRDLVAAAASNGEHSLALELVRAKRTRKASLRW